MKNTLPCKLLIVIIPFILSLIMGCGGGGGGVNNAVSVIQREEKILKSWQHIKFGEPEQAEISFRGALRDDPTENQKNDIFCGLGWALAAQRRWDESVDFFKPVSGLTIDAMIGIAGVYMARGNDGDLAEAVKYLERAGMKEVTATLESERGLAFGSAEAHAMLAACYLLQGKDEAAVAQAGAAKSFDNGWSNTTVDRIYGAILDDLGLVDATGR